VPFTAAKLFPEEGNWPALESKDEEEVDTVYLDGDEAGPEDDAVRAVDSNPKQEDSDTELEEDVGDNVSRFA
jgi:hypothetical protein